MSKKQELEELQLLAGLLKIHNIKANIPQKRMEELDENMLFDGSDALFKEIGAQSNIYFEYGIGKSTAWMAENSNADIFSVETDYHWVEKIKQELKEYDQNRLNFHWCDLGPVGAWGRPNSYNYWERFPNYTDWLWRQAQRPDLVLIDGRFRVASFLTSLLNADEGTAILFDDYKKREGYHIVENYIKPEEQYGRQALFIRPNDKDIDKEAIKKMIESFRFVKD